MSAGIHLTDEEADKKAEGPLSLKGVAILAVLLLLLSVISVICYFHSIGINLWVDALAELVPVCGVSAFFCWAWLVFLFVYYLFKRRFARAFISLAISLVFLLSVAIIMPATGRLPGTYFRGECAGYMQEMGAALKMYAKDHNDMLPAEDWCDVLVMDYEQNTIHLFCRGDFWRFKEGESSYALNAHIMTKKLSELPADTVMAFETDYVGENPGDLIPEGQRKYTQKIGGSGNTRLVRKGAWNQMGDISIISYKHHAGLGCNILFADGHVEFVKKKEVLKLRWKP